MEQLIERYRINETNLALRKQFNSLTSTEINCLKRLTGWANRVAEPIASAFYDHQFAFSETRAFFENYVQENGTSLSELRQHLERVQAMYFRQIFEEAASGGNYGTPYFEKRLHVGRVHNIIGLPLKWYLGSYPLYQDLILKYLRRSYWFRPVFQAEAARAILAALNYDMQAMIESFFNDVMQSSGLDLARIDIQQARHDISDFYEPMKDMVREALVQRAKESRRLATLSSQLANAATQAGQATFQIAQTMHQVATGTQQQADGVSRTAASIDQMRRAIDSIAHGAEEQSVAVNKAVSLTAQISSAIHQVTNSAEASTKGSAQAAHVAHKGAESIYETVQGMETIKTKVGLSAAKVKQMGDHSKEIGNIVKTIDDIASQTNLLALNAAIEAARAGEHGKGFAIVADEVRKLAEKSTTATKEIATLIKTIQDTVAESVRAMDEGVREVETGVNRASQSGQVLNDIMEVIDAVNLQVGQIVVAAQQMNTASNELVIAMDTVSMVARENTTATHEMSVNANNVSQAIENIASVSEENSAAVEEVSAAAEEMSAQVSEVTDSAQSLSEMADALQVLAAKFKVNEGEIQNENAQGARNDLFDQNSLVIAWDDAMTTGIPKVDEQHKDLIRQLNVLIEAMSQGKGRQQIEKLLDYLTDYALNHFGYEEKCMEEYRCPVAAKNKDAHAKFVERFLALRAEIQKEGPTPRLVIEARHVLSDWLVNHILRVDSKLHPCVTKTVAARNGKNSREMVR